MISFKWRLSDRKVESEHNINLYLYCFPTLGQMSKSDSKQVVVMVQVSLQGSVYSM